MNDHELLRHIESIDEKLGSMDPVAAVGFGLLCLERQMELFRRTSFPATWARELVSVLRSAIDELWSLMGGRDFDAARVSLPDPD
jgi:hypothetical protein